jgi:3-methyladenine DNA glycosylase AlkD
MNALRSLKSDLKKLANPKKAKVLQGFFKTGKGQYGEGDIFLGIVVPKQRELVKKYWRDISLANLDKLIRSKFHEERLIALLILVGKYQSLSWRHPELRVQPRSEGSLKQSIPRDSSDAIGMTQKTIFNFYLSHTNHINNWDLVDLSAPKIIGDYLADKNKPILYKLAKSQNLWERRIAILSTFDFIYKGDPKETLKIAKMLLTDNHNLIHKAVGWMLREVGKRCDEKYLIDFLNKYCHIMPRTMLRYAIERLPEQKRKYYLRK